MEKAFRGGFVMTTDELNRIEGFADGFRRRIKDYVLTVLREDQDRRYIRLRLSPPERLIGSYEIITWPDAFCIQSFYGGGTYTFWDRTGYFRNTKVICGNDSTPVSLLPRFAVDILSKWLQGPTDAHREFCSTRFVNGVKESLSAYGPDDDYPDRVCIPQKRADEFIAKLRCVDNSYCDVVMHQKCEDLAEEVLGDLTDSDDLADYLIRQPEAYVHTYTFLETCCVFIRALDLYHAHRMQEVA